MSILRSCALKQLNLDPDVSYPSKTWKFDDKVVERLNNRLFIIKKWKAISNEHPVEIIQPISATSARIIDNGNPKLGFRESVLYF